MKTNSFKLNLRPFFAAGIWTLPLFLLLLSMLSACKKDASPAPSADLTGTWKLVNLKVFTKITATVKGSSLSSLDEYYYTTVKNGGTIAFQGGVVNSADLTYATPDTTKSYLTTYENGVATSRDTSSLNFTEGPNSFKSDYKVLGSDSVYIKGAANIFNILNDPSSDLLNGMKFNVNGNILTLTNRVNSGGTFLLNGVEVTSNIQATSLTTLQKQ